MKYDIILINPSYGKVYGFKEDISSKLPPIGLMYLSSYLKKNNYRVKIFDLEVNDESELEKISKYSQIFGITCVTSTFPQARDIARKIKQNNEESIIILGGPHASAVGKDIMKICKEIDIIVYGEGELILKELLDREFKNLTKIKGITYRKNSKIVVNPPNLNFVDVNKLPFPDHYEIDYSKYKPSLHRNIGQPFAVMITSRGCPFNCKYCGTQTIFGRNVRFRSIENVMEEVEYLINNFKVQNTIFWDDTFTLNRQYVAELCDSLKKYNLAWSCNTRPDCINREILKKMKDAGCKIIFYGVESSNNEILRKLGRNMNTDKSISAIKITKEIGIRCTASMMIGTPFDTKEQIEKNIKFMIKLNSDLAFFSPFAPHPGTPIYNFCVEKNIIPPWREWLKMYFEGIPLNHPIANKHLTRKQIHYYLEKAYKEFYSRKEFFEERERKWTEDWEIKILEHLREKFWRCENE